MTVSAPRRVLSGGIVAMMTLALGIILGSTASAATLPLSFRGNFPLIGNQTVATVVNVNIPATATKGSSVSLPFTLNVNAGQTAADGLRITGATRISGSITASVTLTASNGATSQIPVNLPIASQAVPATGPLVFIAAGNVTFTVPAAFASGAATSKVNPSASTTVVTNGLLGTFTVPLSLYPASQNTLLGTTTIS